MSQVVTRFAPSPTGLLHLGNVRTALLNWLYARKHGGRFLLRFEDTDQDRSQIEYSDAIKADLSWLGLEWDGDVLFQSGHAGKHGEALKRLAEQGMAYRCFCSESQLSLDRKLATSRGLPPRYVGRCRELGCDEAEERAEHESYVWRLAIHAKEGEVKVPDLLHGQVTFARRDLDDPVVVRSDGSFTFLLPNAVDDAVDGITHALRGDDHLTNSAYQVWLLERLGYQAPIYLHHGLLLGQDGAKLSKRSGSHSVAELREEGLLPGALVQAMGRLGHPNMPDEAHCADELALHLDEEHISTSSVRWSDEEMWRWHTRLLHELDSELLIPLLLPHVPETSHDRLASFASLIEKNLERVEDAALFQRLLDVQAPLEAEALPVVHEAGAEFYQHALDAWHANPDWKSWTFAVKEKTGNKGKALFMPLRVALSGALHGPEMSEVVSFLGYAGIVERIECAISECAKGQAET
ncbi:glutamyl-tRNA synthetase [Mariprofundus micogutta]|uniref:Glutamate--tRNA ligase n=1 Tax=Mariprofundus micogutta TaxID=1921010 RepID=A0A1L8CQM7_9PROT|nr:glutamate--tRNA ligase [Mariprofundus micogutta]GAV21197.1 glutamyl-tRNA synthetase [Mariprofundus micogutta]